MISQSDPVDRPPVFVDGVASPTLLPSGFRTVDANLVLLFLLCFLTLRSIVAPTSPFPPRSPGGAVVLSGVGDACVGIGAA